MSEARESLSWQLRPERAEDGVHVEELNEAAFGPGRFAKTAYRLREGVAPVSELSFVAVENGVRSASGRSASVAMRHCCWARWRWKQPSVAAASALR
jgi:predicted N-acetyltransferase YhbS